MQRLLLAYLVIAVACGDNATPQKPSDQPDAGMMPDSGPTEIPILRAHSGGAPSTGALVGTRAYIGVGPRLAIWDLAVTPPALLGETAPMRGVINAAVVAGDRVYVAERTDLDSQIHVIDVTM